jgi:tripartite-type tricarboxylate transporter receptor subunit TctC
MMAQTTYRRRTLVATAVVLALAGGIEGTLAQTSVYPSRPVRLIVPFEPGGSTDSTARLVAKKLGELLHTTFYIENRTGAGGNIGTDLVAKAQPDGYTLLWANVAPIAINPHIYSKLSFDPTKDFVPITLATVFPNVIVAKPSLPADTLAAFRAKAKTEFKDLFFASAGNGSSTHLAAEWLNIALGTQWTHVPYKGGGPALMAVIGGQVDLYFSSIPAALSHLQAGTLKAIATTGAVRDPALPDVPTVAESGLPDFEVLNWNGLLAPTGTPQNIIDLLNKAAVEALTSPDLVAQLAKQGAHPQPMTQAEFAEFIKKDSARWAEVVKTIKLKIN